MRDAVIVSAARTPIGRAYKGAFNATPGPSLGALSIAEAVKRAGIEGGEIDDVVWGAVLTQGGQALNIGRLAALRAGLPVTVAAQTIDRQCSSGLMAIATASKQVVIDRQDIVVAGGQDSISTVQTTAMRMEFDPALIAMHQAAYMPMLQTAEVVAKRYGVARDVCDEYAFQSQQRTAAAQAAGRFDAEIVAAPATMNVTDKATGETSQKEVTLAKDEGNRPDTTLEGLKALQPVMGPEGNVTAGNASQLSDGSAAVVVMEGALAAKKGLAPLGRYVGMAVAGTEPDEMGIGPVFAVPKLLEPLRPEDGRHRAVGTQRGLRGAGALLPRPARHPRRTAQRRWRRDLDRPSLWHDRRALHDACADRRQAARREACCRHHVHRRRHGRGGAVRGVLAERGGTMTENMGIVEILGLAGSLSLLSGWRLYLTILATGLAMRSGVVPLPEHLECLQVLANPWVMGVAGFAALCEFFADKVAWLDSVVGHGPHLHPPARRRAARARGGRSLRPGDPGDRLRPRRRRRAARPRRQGRRAGRGQHQPRTVQQCRGFDDRGRRDRGLLYLAYEYPGRRRGHRAGAAGARHGADRARLAGFRAPSVPQKPPLPRAEIP